MPSMVAVTGFRCICLAPESYLFQRRGIPVAEAEFEAFLVTIGYRIGDVTPRVLYAKLEESAAIG